MTRKLFLFLALSLLMLASANCSIGPDVVGVTDDTTVDRVVTYTEDFEKSTASGTSYVTGSFVGNNGLTWNYVQTAWSGAVIAGSKSPVLGMNRTPVAEVSTTVADGVGTLSFKFKKAYSTAVSLSVYANDTLLGTVTTTKTTTQSKTFTVNKSGAVTIRFVQSGTTAGQVSIDTLSWTSYGTTSSSSSVSSTSSSVSSISSSVSSSSSSVSSSSSSTAATGTIKVGSFNIEIFGTTKISRANVLYTLAHIATRYDIIAIQEVGSNGTPSESTATTVMDTYIAKINSIAGAGAYSYVRGHQYAFVYKNATITKKASQLYSGSKTFTYTPLVGNFAVKSGNFDFAMLTIHTSPTVATTEIPALTTAMADVRTLYSEQDVICLGDYNADGSYYSPGTSGGDLAGFSSSTYVTVIKNGTDTTVSPNNSYTYDRMQLYTASAEDYAGVKGVLKFADYYTISNLEGTTTTVGTEGALSDHYPIWAEFYTGRDTN